jgi:hypothetical protein
MLVEVMQIAVQPIGGAMALPSNAGRYAPDKAVIRKLG